MNSTVRASLMILGGLAGAGTAAEAGYYAAMLHVEAECHTVAAVAPAAEPEKPNAAMGHFANQPPIPIRGKFY